MGAVVLIVPASLLLFIDFPSPYTSSSFFSPPQIHPLQSKPTSTHSYHPHTPHLSSPCLNLPHTSFSRFLLQSHQHVHHTSLAPTPFIYNPSPAFTTFNQSPSSHTFHRPQHLSLKYSLHPTAHPLLIHKPSPQPLPQHPPLAHQSALKSTLLDQALGIFFPAFPYTS